MKRFLTMQKSNMRRSIALILAFVMIATNLPISAFAADEEGRPEIGTAENAADYMTVINNGVDCTQQYKENQTINVAKNTSGILGGIDFGLTNTYVFSASVTFTEDVSHQPPNQNGWGSIRLRLGKGVDGSGNEKNIEVCMRPNLNHQWLVLNGNGETDVKSEYKSGFNKMNTYLFTAKYENGKVSFWIDDTLIFDSVDISSQLKYITLQPGFYSQECNGKISNVQIWGDVEPKVCPVFDSKKDTNQMETVIVTNPLTGITGTLENCGASTDVINNTRLSFHGIQYGQSYNFSVNAHALDNPEISNEGLRIKVATAKKDNKLWNIEIGVRPESRMIAVFAVSTNVADVVLGEPMWNQDVSFNSSSYVVKYKGNGNFHLYRDGILTLDNFNIEKYGYTNVTPCLGLGSELSAFVYSDMKLWGDVNASVASDENMMGKVYISNPFTGVTGKVENGSISTDRTDGARMNFKGLLYGENYIFSSEASFSNNNKGYEGLIFKVATAKKDNVDYDIEVRVRGNASLIFARNNNGEVVFENDIVWGKGSNFDEKHTYTVEYKTNNCFDFYMDGVLVFYNYNLEQYGYTNITPALGVGSEVCAFTYSNMKLWGELEAPEAPKFNSEADKNIMEKVAVTNPFTGVTGRLENCSVATEQTTGGTLSFRGIQYKGAYNFTANATMKNNADLGYESLRFQVATAKKGDKEYIIEIAVRPDSRMIGIFGTAKDVAEEAIQVLWEQPISHNVESNYAIEYKANDCLSFYNDGIYIFHNFDLTKYGYTDVVPYIGVRSEKIAFTLSDMKLWGEMEVPTAPEFNAETDENIMDEVVVTNTFTGVTGKLENCGVSTEQTTGGTLDFHGIQHMDSYKFTANAILKNNANLDYESLRFQVATAKKGDKEYIIEIAMRPDSRMIGIFGTAKDVAEEPIQVLWEQAISHDVQSSYAIEYKTDNCIDFYNDGMYIFYNFDLAKHGYTDVAPYIGVRSEKSAFSLSDMKLWGNISVLKAPEFNESTDTNLIPEVSVTDVFSNKTYKLDSCTLSSKKNETGRVEFDGVKIKANYTFYANASFSDNKNLLKDGNEYNWESLIFQVAKAEKSGKEYSIEVRVRRDWLLVCSVDESGKETIIYQSEASNAFDMVKAYIVDYHRDGTFDFWQNGVALLYGYDLATEGYSNITPAPGLGCEVCNFSFTDMKLVSEGAKVAPKVPKKPKTNGDYADTMQVPQSTVITYENGTVFTTTDKVPATAIFEYLPFKANETYVYGFNINTHKAENVWMGPRIIFGEDASGRDLALFITQYEIVVAAGSEVLYKKDFVREFKQDYRVDLLVEPDAVTVWIDNILMIEKCKTPNKVLAKTGILFENTIAYMSNIDLYYTDLVEYIPPVIPKKPVLKELKNGQYNAAEWMKVTLNGKSYCGYFGNKLSSTDSSAGYTYLFDNLPITDDMSYYYSATFKVNESSAIWKGPRFIFRYSDKVPMYVAVTKTGIMVLAGGEEVKVSPFELELGKKYDIVIYSTPDSVSVWLDGKCILENIDLSAYCKKGALNARLGLLFELCRADVTNLAIYGDKVVFNPDYVDIDLYNDEYYRMSGIPAMPKGGINLFQNIIMTDHSEGSLGAAFDSKKNVLTTQYNNGTGEVVFTDAIGSSNINGLKNGSGYVFSFTYKVDSWESETIGESGLWMILNSSTSPSTTQPYQVSLGISGDALLLNVYKNGAITDEQTIPFTRQNGKEYNISVVHGKNWIKLYVDNVLKMVATDLPIYNVEFTFGLNNICSQFENFMLYEFVNSGLKIRDLSDKKEAMLAGTTLYDAEEYLPVTKWDIPVVLMVVLGVIVVASLSGVIAIYASHNKRRKQEIQMRGGEDNA